MSGIALGAAFAAVQLVYRAHSKVKTSKARCARLVERCQFVVDRLERIAATKGGDAIVRERIHELERAFEQTAQTIVQVGQQGVIVSLLRSETNALLIESCNEALTELITLFNLEEIVDVRRWQDDLEVARVRDHRELLSMGQRIESGNAAINRELTQQGATIAEVLRVIHDINAGLRETVKIALPLALVDAATAEGPSRTRTGRSVDGSLRVRMASRWWPPMPTPTPEAKVMIDTGTGTHEPETAKSRSPPPPRRSLSLTQKCGVKIVPLANVFSKLSSSFSLSSHSPSRGAAGSTKEWPCDACSPVTPRLMSASSSSCCPLPAEPPPPYRLRVANPAPEYPAAPMSSSRFTAASVEAVRAPDSPVPTFPSPKLSTESVFGSTESLASVSAEPRCTGAVGGARPVLRRKETIRFGLSSGYVPT